MSWKLPEYSPWWARRLGLKIDWQSRPTDRTRTYHNRDRTVEVVTGYQRGGFAFACDLSRYEEHTSLHLQVPGLGVHVRVAPGAPLPTGWNDIAVDRGVEIFAGDLVFKWKGCSKRFTLNPFRWHGYERTRLRVDGEWDGTNHWTEAGKAIRWYSEEHPYAITSLPTYYESTLNPKGPHFSIETWETVATCYVERTIRTRRWLPFWRKVEFWVDFDLNEEVGHGKGSWKGGTVGFSEQMLPGDRISEVVQRAARKGRGR